MKNAQVLEKKIQETVKTAVAPDLNYIQIQQGLSALVNKHAENVHGMDGEISAAMVASILAAYYQDLATKAVTFLQKETKKDIGVEFNYNSEQIQLVVDTIIVHIEPDVVVKQLYGSYVQGYDLAVKAKTEPNKVIPK